MTQRATVTAVLCTYRGERYVDEQLASILEQDRPVDELIVTDDGSDDRTLDIVRDRLGRPGGCRPPVRILEGRTAGGVTTSLERAIAVASGTVLLLADQDDRWYPSKVAALVPHLERGATLAFSDADLVDEHGRDLQRRLWRSYGFGPRAVGRARKAGLLHQLLRWNVVTGATMAIRRDVARAALPLPRAGVHDWSLALVAAGIGDAVAHAEALTAYRVHPANQVGVPHRSPVALARDRLAPDDVREQEHRQLVAVAERLQAAGAGAAAAAVLRRAEFSAARGGLPERLSGRVGPVLRGLVSGSYHHRAHGLRSALHDLTVGA